MSLPAKVYFPDHLIASQVANFNACISAWNNLSLSTQAIWNVYASLNPVVDLSGHIRFLSGFNLFLQSNISLISLGLLLEDGGTPAVGADVVPNYEIIGYSNSLHVDFYPDINFPNSDLVIYATRPYVGSTGVEKKEIYYIGSFSNPNAGIFDITQSFEYSLFLDWASWFNSHSSSIKFFVCLVNRVTGIASYFKELVWSFDNLPAPDWSTFGTVLLPASFALPGVPGVFMCQDSMGTVYMYISSSRLLLYSSDNGLSWNSHSIPTVAGQSLSLTIDSSDILYLNGQAGVLWTSSDFGVTWVSRPSVGGLTYPFGVFKMPDGNFIFISFNLGSTGVIRRSVDNLANWSTVFSLASSSGFQSLCYLENGIVLVGAANLGKIARSVNYGASFVTVNIGVSNTRILSMVYCGNGIVMAVDSLNAGAVYRSIDYGLSWSLSNTGLLAANFSFIFYLGNGILLVARLSGGVIYRSTDYGINWASVPSVSGLGTFRYLFKSKPNSLIFAISAPDTVRIVN